MRFPVAQEEAQQDGNIFEQIFIDHWEEFKKLNPMKSFLRSHQKSPEKMSVSRSVYPKKK